MDLTLSQIREYFKCYNGDVSVVMEKCYFDEEPAMDPLYLGGLYTFRCKSTGKEAVYDGPENAPSIEDLERIEEEICN